MPKRAKQSPRNKRRRVEGKVDVLIVSADYSLLGVKCYIFPDLSKGEKEYLSVLDGFEPGKTIRTQSYLEKWLAWHYFMGALGLVEKHQVEDAFNNMELPEEDVKLPKYAEKEILDALETLKTSECVNMKTLNQKYENRMGLIGLI